MSENLENPPSAFPEAAKKPLPAELVLPDLVKDEHLYKFMFFRLQVAHVELLVASARASLSSLSTDDAERTLQQIKAWEKEQQKVLRLRDDIYNHILSVYKIDVDAGERFTDGGEIRRK